MTLHSIPEMRHYPGVFAPAPSNGKVLYDPVFHAFFEEAMHYIEDMRLEVMLSTGERYRKARHEYDLITKARPSVFCFNAPETYIGETVDHGICSYHFSMCMSEPDDDDEILVVDKYMSLDQVENLEGNVDRHLEYLDADDHFFVAGGIVPIFRRHYPLVEKAISLPAPLPQIGDEP